MRKLPLLILLVFSALGFSVTASHALEPGCNPEVMTLLSHQADAMRARNRAYQREIISRNESTLGLTCFDQAMRLSSRLGYIFSDNVPAAPPLANTVAFGEPLSYPRWGADRVLAKDLDDVVSPVYDEQMQNFPPPVIPNPPNVLTAFVNTLEPIIANIVAFQDSEAPRLADIKNRIIEIDNLIGTLPSVSPGGLQARIDEINALITELNNRITVAEAARLAGMQPLLNSIKNKVMGAQTAMDCTRLVDLWEDGNPASAFAPVEGEYITGTPYYPLRNLLGGSRPGAGVIFQEELATATNSNILNMAMTDLLSLDAPGSLSSWPTTPVFAPTATTAEIISGM